MPEVSSECLGNGRRRAGGHGLPRERIVWDSRRVLLLAVPDPMFPAAPVALCRGTVDTKLPLYQVKDSSAYHPNGY